MRRVFISLTFSPWVTWGPFRSMWLSPTHSRDRRRRPANAPSPPARSGNTRYSHARPPQDDNPPGPDRHRLRAGGVEVLRAGSGIGVGHILAVHSGVPQAAEEGGGVH